MSRFVPQHTKRLLYATRTIAGIMFVGMTGLMIFDPAEYYNSVEEYHMLNPARTTPKTPPRCADRWEDFCQVLWGGDRWHDLRRTLRTYKQCKAAANGDEPTVPYAMLNKDNWLYKDSSAQHKERMTLEHPLGG